MSSLAETAYLVALCRALESERSDPLFQDPWARNLAGGRGQILQILLGHQQRCVDAIAIRTHLIDNLVLELVHQADLGFVLNLGAGLDTRPYRLSLPSSLFWIEVDRSEILKDKQQKLQQVQPQCILEQIQGDLTEPTFRQTLFAYINQWTKPVLVLTEGFLGYWSANQVADLAGELYQQQHIGWWAFELASPEVLLGWHTLYAHQLYDQYVANGKTTFQFAPVEGPEFFRPWGWQVAKQHNVLEKLHQLQRTLPLVSMGAKIMQWINTQKPHSQIVLLERCA